MLKNLRKWLNDFINDFPDRKKCSHTNLRLRVVNGSAQFHCANCAGTWEEFMLPTKTN